MLDLRHVVAVLCVAGATAHAADRLVPEPNVTRLKPGVSAPFSVRRESDDGGVVGTSSLVVTVTSLSPAAGVRGSPSAMVTSSAMLTIPMGAQVPLTPRWLWSRATSGTVDFSVSSALGTFMVPVTVDSLPVQDDFESGASSPDWSLSTTSAVAFDVVSAAAHRGDAGIRVTDAQNLAGAGAESSLGIDFDLLPLPNWYVRVWLRFDSVAGNNGVEPLQIYQSCVSNGSASVYAQQHLVPPKYSLGVFAADGGFTFRNQVADMLVGQWRLLDVEVTGMGTASGAAELWVDGVQVASVTGIDWVGCSHSGFRFGETYTADRSVTPVYSFDDVRGGHLPHATWGDVVLAPPVAGRCSRGDVVLLDVHDAGAPAPYAVDVAMTSSNGGVYLASDCTTPVGAVTIAPGLNAAAFYLRPADAGTLTVTMNHIDFLWRSPRTFVVAPDDGGTFDAGTPDAGDASVPDAGQVRVYATGCGCHSAQGALTLAALALCRRRARKPRI